MGYNIYRPGEGFPTTFYNLYTSQATSKIMWLCPSIIVRYPVPFLIIFFLYVVQESCNKQNKNGSN